MASIIRVKRSSSATAPTNGTLNYGELAASFGGGTQANNGERLFIGNASSNPVIIGGEYYTDLIANAPGVVAAGANASTASNGFIPIMDRESSGNPGGGGLVNNLPRVDQWSVDNLTLDGNVLSSNDTDGDIILRPNGAGRVIIEDENELTFGTSEDSRVYYNEASSDKVQVDGAGWVFNTTVELGGGSGGFSVDNIGIKSNQIFSKSGGGNTIYIDPYPDGLSSDGLVIVKGSLQVDGTTTTVNSTSATLNDPIMSIGDVTSTVTVMAPVAAGVSTVTVDSIAGINTSDTLACTGIDASGIATVASYDTGTKVVTFTGTTTAGISTTTQITVTHAFDTNTDRGISFQYNTSTGASNNKTGFIGYNDSAGENSNAPVRSFTYIPDATITGNVVTGTRGVLDIGEIYFQTGNFDATGNGIVYFDTSGKMVGAAATSSGITTSNYVLTTDASGIPKWTTTLDGGTY